MNWEELLASLSPADEARVLSQAGHWLTILGRGSPSMLDEQNELHHRLYLQMEALARGKRAFSAQTMGQLLAQHITPAEVVPLGSM